MSAPQWGSYERVIPLAQIPYMNFFIAGETAVSVSHSEAEVAGTSTGVGLVYWSGPYFDLLLLAVFYMQGTFVTIECLKEAFTEPRVLLDVLPCIDIVVSWGKRVKLELSRFIRVPDMQLVGTQRAWLVRHKDNRSIRNNFLARINRTAFDGASG